MSQAEQREEAVFEAALKLSGDERAAYLEQICAGDAELRRRVELLLSAFERAGGFMNQPATPERAAKSSSPPSEKPGDRIGRYKLLEQIGEGGCGVVYVAEQEEPVRRRVALKVIKLGMDTKQVIARFDAERQALAIMDSPNIAKVFDAGATETGRPFFVMELVRGVKITDYCDQHHVPPGERLNLFIQVCRAIQHAHQKGVIHRDIKPSNVLVASDDGVPVPKVIDFGIAKATQGRLTDQTVYTAFEQFIGTPAYMSPEQAALSLQDIDTRSDIYSLGVLLYELLTGTTPFDAKELLAAGLDEMRRTIREVEPVRPSTRLTQAAKSETRNPQSEQPAIGQVAVHKDQSAIPSDLDWIVMKCLEKDRTRRYETANGLATDILRHLNNEPIVARPPSQWYSLQKMARRNRAALIAAACVLLALLLAVVVLAISNVRIRNEQSQKEMALFTSLKSQAMARRQSRQMGQRLDSLAAIHEASRIRQDADLRDAAIAALAVPDLRPGLRWKAFDGNDQGITFDANYTRYAWIDSQQVIRIHTVADGKEVRRFPSGPPAQHLPNCFLFSPDGRLLAKFEKGDRWSIWGVETGQLLLRTPATSAAFGFAPDSTQFAIPTEDSIVLISLDTGRERKRWPTRQRPHVMEFSPNGLKLATSPFSAEAISIYDVGKGELLAELPVGLSGDRSFAWHSSGKYLAVSANQHIQLWDVEAGALVSALDGHAQVVTALSFDPTGRWLVSDSWDGTPRLWQPSPAREWMRFFSGLNQLRFSTNGRYAGVIFPGGGQAQLLEFIPSEVYHTFVGSHLENEYSFSDADISADGRLLALVSKEVSVRELPSGRELATLPTHPRWLKFHPNGKELIVSGFKEGFDIWPIGRNAAASNRIRLGPPRHVPVPFVPCEFALARDGRTIAASVPDLAEAKIADLYNGTLGDLKFPHTNTDSVTLSSDAQWLGIAGWQSTQAQLWNVRTGERVLNVTVERARVTFTPDDREFVVSTSQKYEFYDVATQKVTRRFQRQRNMHYGWIAYSADGKLMALEVSPRVIRLCEVKTGRTVANLQDPGGNLNRWMGFTPDGTQLIVAATYEGAIHRWDLRALRVELKAMGLDWDWPEFAPLSAEEKNPLPLEMEVVGGESR